MYGKNKYLVAEFYIVSCTSEKSEFLVHPRNPSVSYIREIRVSRTSVFVTQITAYSAVLYAMWLLQEFKMVRFLYPKLLRNNFVVHSYNIYNRNNLWGSKILIEDYNFINVYSKNGPFGKPVIDIDCVNEFISCTPTEKWLYQSGNCQV